MSTMSPHDSRAPVDAFVNLIHGDGTPDVHARKDALDKIIDCLSNHEIRNLRNRLNTISFKKDICLSLPVELLLNVSEYLQFEDVMVARHISRAWRDKFSSPDFIVGIIKLHFRTQWERTDLKVATAAEELVKWFHKASMKRVRKNRGHYLSMSAYHYLRFGRLMPTYSEFDRQYDSGRVACQFGDSFVVQNLKEGPLTQLKMYMDLSRMPIRTDQWVLSNQFLVAQAHRGTASISKPFRALEACLPLSSDKKGRLNLIAWSLTSEDIHRVRLPNRTKYISARGQHVGLITQASELLIWNIGGSMVPVKNSEIQELGGSYWTPAAIIFHPLNEGQFFVFYHNWPGAEILVQEFVHGNYHKTYRGDFTAELTSPVPAKNLDLRMIRVVGTNGICIIGWDVRQTERDRPNSVKTFNMYTCRFGTMEYPSPVLPRPLEESVLHLWKEDTLDLPFALNYAERCPVKVDDDDFEIVFGNSGYVVWAFDDTPLPVAGSLLDLSLSVAPEDRPFPFRPKR